MPFIQFQHRRDTAALWTSNNPTLASGEMGLETDTSLFKIGNGTTPWVSLPYGGLNGATGATASVSVGTVTTLGPGSPATVTNSGTTYASILNFGIPQGPTGDTPFYVYFSNITYPNNPPQLADTLSYASPAWNLIGFFNSDTVSLQNTAKTKKGVGTITALTSTTMSVNITGVGTMTDYSEMHYVMREPPSGATGATASVSVGTVTTLAPGSAATVTDVGTSYASILVFGIPQGETGGSTFSVPTAICATARSTASQSFTANVSDNIQHDAVDFSYGITTTTGPTGYFEVPSAGVYKIIPSVQLSPGNNGHLHVWLKVNGTNVANTGTYLTFKNGDYQVFTTEILLELQSNDQVQVWAQPSVTGSLVQYIAAGGTAPNDYPEAPGIITNMYKLRDA